MQKTALITTVLGLIILYFVSSGISAPVVEHFDVDNEEVKVEGSIVKMVDRDNVKFISIDGCKEEMLELVVFSDEDIYVKEGDYISATGTIEEYKGKKELIVEELSIR